MSESTLDITSLPLKVRVPIEQLLAYEYLDQKTLDTALLAVPRADQRYKLMFYIAAIRGLRDAHVPVDDTVRMAVQFGRSVDFSWSVNRWNDEHNLLSRLATLHTLSASSVRYDLAAFTSLLPARYPGYLIPSSRRLGMEGLRQRHCVASYDKSIRAGLYAIASVFMAGSRWTVQLVHHTSDDGKPTLLIKQIKGRFNGIPTRNTRAAVVDALGLEPEVVEPVAGREEGDNVRGPLARLRDIMPALENAGVRTVISYLDGSGDSGFIEAPQFLGADGLNFKPAFDPEIAPEVERVLSEAVERYIESTDVDWYNNDGGFGSVIIHVTTRAVEAEINVRHTESEVAHYEEYSLDTLDAITR